MHPVSGCYNRISVCKFSAVSIQPVFIVATYHTCLPPVYETSVFAENDITQTCDGGIYTVHMYYTKQPSSCKNVLLAYGKSATAIHLAGLLETKMKMYA